MLWTPEDANGYYSVINSHILETGTLFERGYATLVDLGRNIQGLLCITLIWSSDHCPPALQPNTPFTML